MTQNQINYNRLLEDKRHNVVSEQETSRHNVASENIDISQVAEQTRHNLATESETYRHNVAYETESRRHNVSSENLQAQQIDVSRLQAAASLQSAKAASSQAAAALAQANTAATRAANEYSLGVAKQDETVRHNQQSERISYLDSLIRNKQVDYQLLSGVTGGIFNIVKGVLR